MLTLKTLNKTLKYVRNVLGIESLLLSTTFLLIASSALASEVPATKVNPDNKVLVPDQPTLSLEQTDQYSQKTNALVQLTSVSELSDVNPSDWAFQALQSLIERYECIVGYSDRTYRGDRNLNRYEFATGLETCLNQINKLIAVGTAEAIEKEDLVTVQRLQSEFAAELSALRGQLDNLEAKVSQLTAQQFAPTLRLKGSAIFAVAGAIGDNKADDDDEPVEENIVFGSRLNLSFETSFTGKDNLILELQARDIPRFDDDVTGTVMTRLGFEGSNDNEFELSTLQYSFPISKQATVYINAQASADDFAISLNPLDSSSRGAISRFGRRNPIYRQIGSTGVGINYEFNDVVSVGLGYLVDDADDTRSGIFKSPYGAIAQVYVEPTDELHFSLTYLRSYNLLDTGTGSELANDPFDGDADHITADSFGLEGRFDISSNFILGGWIGYTKAKAEDLSGEPEASIFNYAITLIFPDLGGEGNLVGIVFGQPPKVTSNDFGNRFTDPDTSLHIEAFYRFKVTDNIYITPGVFMITNPEHNDSNNTLYVGVIRTTFRF
ncbi:iron uptake porin [Scytonema sp. UIC 10036]|uniref:iron uptake porin n=1 Tax=Scytonema sp. UIC 10036 TaxID=2304196 RepID=UPI0012DAC6A6|nr:iron uptake porin [Scytonema sp. UIC 10036]MUG92065.1 iron uptake porin [Scytonema sp. UIC 10036]